MSAKDNFAQAMKELLNGNEADNPATEAEERYASPSSFSSFSQPDPRPAREADGDDGVSEAPRYASYSAPEISAPVVTAPPAPAPAPEFRSAASMYGSQPTFSVPAPPPVASAPTFSAPAAAQAPEPTPAPQTPVYDDGETTVIAAGTTIMGDITTAAGLRVSGNVKGNLKVASLLEMEGKVIGDIEAIDLTCTGSVVRGNINVSGSVTIDDGTTIVGDVVAHDVDINGKIKGNLTVEDRGRFQQSAVLVGNLMAGTVSIDEGAMLKGDISITTMQEADAGVDDASFDIG